jgi:hypothetical protein
VVAGHASHLVAERPPADDRAMQLDRDKLDALSAGDRRDEHVAG